MMEWIDALPTEQFCVLFVVVAVVLIFLPVTAADYAARRRFALPRKVDDALRSTTPPVEPNRWEVLNNSARNEDGPRSYGL